MAKFERIKYDPAAWGRILAGCQDAVVYQSPGWLAFLAESQRGEPVVAALKEGNETLGYFSGLLVRKFGLKILGSPFRNWSTPYMGFNLLPNVPRRLAAEALPEFAFKELGCLHFEVVDLFMSQEDSQGLGYGEEMRATFQNDLTQTEEVILGKMNSYRRRDIRRAEKHGVVIEEVQDPAFAAEYAEQLKDVFAKQNLVPNFGVERVSALIKHLQPTGMLLMLRALDAERHHIATGLYVGMNQTAFYWGGASWRQYQHLHPNELLQWHAMRYWKKRGMKDYNLVGTMDFKARFGGAQTAVPFIAKSRYRVISKLRSSAPRLANLVMRAAWKFKKAAQGSDGNGPE